MFVSRSPTKRERERGARTDDVCSALEYVRSEVARAVYVVARGTNNKYEVILDVISTCPQGKPTTGYLRQQ